MRRILVLLTLLALIVPMAALARAQAPGDGSLAVRDLDGAIRITVVRGATIGRCTQCSLLIDENRDDVQLRTLVTGASGVDVDGDGDRDRYVGKDVRWKVIGNSFRVVVTRGSDVDLSVIGRGSFRIQGTAGLYVLNGSDPVPVLSQWVFSPLNAHVSP